MSWRVAGAYVGLAVAVVLAWQLGAIPGWVAGTVLAAAAVLLLAAAWFGFTRPDRPDEGRHLATGPTATGDEHRDKSASLAGWLHRAVWRREGPDGTDPAAGSEEPTVRIDRAEATQVDLESPPSLPQAIERSRGSQ